MPLPLIPLIVGALGAGLLHRHGANKQAEAVEAQKAQKSSTDAFIKVLGELSQKGDVAGVTGLKNQVLSLPQGSALYEGSLAQAHGEQLKQQTMRGFVAGLLPGVTGNPGTGAPPNNVPTPTTPQADLSTVSSRLAQLNQTPTLQRTPAQLAERDALVGAESQLTDRMLAPLPADASNIEHAQKDLNLTPQERNLYQYHLTNLGGPGKVTNPDGSISTVYQSSFDIDGRTYNIPTVWNGQILEPDAALKKAREVGLNKFPSYPSQDQAESRYQQMHNYMERDTQQFLNKEGDYAFPQLPPMLKGKGITTVTIPKEVFGFEIHASRDEALNSVIGGARQKGFSDAQIYENLRQQGINPPQALQHSAFNDAASRFITSDEMLKSPRAVLQKIAEQFPGTDPKALTSFGQQAFTAAYVGAKERLRKTGQFVTDRQLAQAAFTEAHAAVGSEFVPDAVLQDLDRSKASTMDNLYSELVDKAASGVPGAAKMASQVLKAIAGKETVEQTAKTMATIAAENAAKPIGVNDLQQMQGKDGKLLPIGTTMNQARGSDVIATETQVSRSKLATDTTQMQFAAKRAIPIFDLAQTRALDLMQKAAGSGAVGKGAALIGVPTALGQALKGFDEFKGKFAGNLRSLSGETAGVITDKDIDRIMSIFPASKDFVNLVTDRREQMIKDFTEIETILSDRLQQEVHPFKQIIGELKAHGASESKFGDVLKDFEKAVSGKGGAK